MKKFLIILITGVLLFGSCLPAIASDVMIDDSEIYVPLGELPKLVSPTDKAVLMARKDFDKLLSQAKAAKETFDGIKLAEIGDVEYEVVVTANGQSKTVKVDVTKKGLTAEIVVGQ